MELNASDLRLIHQALNTRIDAVDRLRKMARSEGDRDALLAAVVELGDLRLLHDRIVSARVAGE